MDQVLGRIEEKMSKFSKGQRRIGKFILEYYQQAAFMTAAKLGEKVGVSESTVVRFATEIGFEGYPHLQKALNEVVVRNLTAPERLEVADSLIGKDDLVKKVFATDGEAIRKTADELDMESFESAVEAMLQAKRIFVIGLRSTSALASLLAHYLKLILHNVMLINAASTLQVFEEIVGIEEGDLAIPISFPRYSRTTIQAAKYARENKAKVLVITDSQQAPICNYADIALFAKNNMLSFVDSLIAPMSLINALIVAVSTRQEAGLSEKLNKLEGLWSEYQIYNTDIEEK